MATLDEITKKILEQIDGSGFQQKGAFNLRHNGVALCHGDSEHIKIKKKEEKSGIDIYIDKSSRQCPITNTWMITSLNQQKFQPFQTFL